METAFQMRRNAHTSARIRHVILSRARSSFAETDAIRLMSGPDADLGTAPLVPVAGLAELVIDIKPGSDENPVNIHSRGVLPVALVGTDTVDPTTLDPTSFVLDDIIPLRWRWNDVSSPDRRGPDGITDLVFFFDSIEVGATLEGLPHGAVATMALEGLIEDGRLGAGSDNVRVIAKGRKRKK